MSDCVTFWLGDRLSAVERACLRSVSRLGHSLDLYCYGKPEGVPEGVELRDAEEVLPSRNVFRNRNGSIAPFADWFRYELQRLGRGTWVDTDVYLLRKLDTGSPYLFGYQEPRVINNAVLRLPQNSPLIPALLRPFESHIVPAWLPWRFVVSDRINRLLGRFGDLSHLPAATFGPILLTAAVKRFGLSAHASPSEMFNPVVWQEASWIRDPRISLDQVTTDRTVAVHLWNERIKPWKNAPAAPGSFLERLQKEGA